MPQARPPFVRLLARNAQMMGALIGLALLASSPAHAQSARAKITAQDIEMADYNGGDLPDGLGGALAGGAAGGQFVVVKLRPTGSLDSSFGTSG